MAGEEGEQLVLALCQLDGAAAFVDLKILGVDRQRAARAHAALGGCAGDHRRAADVRLHAGHQLAHGKGLGDVVVRADLQAEDLVLLLLAGGENDDRHIVALGAQSAADVKAHHLRHHHVEQDEVGLFLARERETRLAVVGLERGVALALEVEADDVHDVHLVLDDEDGFFRLHAHFSSFLRVRRA